MVDGHIEYRFDLTPLTAMANELRLTPTSDDKAKRIDQNRLTGARLSCKYMKPIMERYRYVFNYCQITNRQFAKHDHDLLMFLASYRPLLLVIIATFMKSLRAVRAASR
ncbi:hypothetical protein D3C84_784650 [compost metagenome]